MPVAKKLLYDIETKLGRSVTNIAPLSGGSINQVYRLQTACESYVLKVNNQIDFPGMFRLEADGLQTIRDTQTIAVPDVLLHEATGDDSYLVLEWVNTGRHTHKSSQALGEQLAQMHRHTANQFGFKTDNYMGSLVQSNKRKGSWSDFFIDQRLKPMVQMAVENSRLASHDALLFEKLYEIVPAIFTEEPPALVHGDLWSGNYLISAEEKPYLIDPAVSYSNREFDIAMTTLFGGFDKAFYEAYQANYPLQSGWQRRLKLWNLYPLLVHVNLFGGGYINQVRECLANFI